VAILEIVSGLKVLDSRGREVAAMRRFIAIVLASLLVFASVSGTSAAGTSTGTITGIARSTGGRPLNSHSVRVRSVRTGDVVATATTSGAGGFDVRNLDPGSYVVEIVDGAGRIVGTSAISTVGDGRKASMTVTAASTELVGGLAATALDRTLAAAGAAGSTAVVVAPRVNASPSR
jgi:hypothetical protein